MKTGVSTSPCAVRKMPSLAADFESVFRISKPRLIRISKKDQQSG
jgi:hypothetical protein